MDVGRNRGPIRASTAQRQWDTERVPPHEQFAVWREVVGEAFVSVSVTRPGAGPFPSTVSSYQVGAISVSRITSEAQAVRRTDPDIAADPGGVFFLNLPLSRGASISQHSRRATLNPGDFALVDGSHAFELEFGKRFTQISLALPLEVLIPRLAAPLEVTAVRVPGTSGTGAIAAAAITALARAKNSLARHEAHSLADHLISLVALALGGVQGVRHSASRSLLARAALDQIDQRHGDPGLSPEDVAMRVGVSVSYLHRLMAERGITFGRALLELRLEQCRRDLEDPARAHWTIAAIAAQHGFRDPAYFARAFKRRYDRTAREHRRALLEQARFGPAPL